MKHPSHIAIALLLVFSLLPRGSAAFAEEGTSKSTVCGNAAAKNANR